jgi:hypothetical protein
MARPPAFKNSVVVSTRFEEESYRMIQEIASLETSCGNKVSAQDLIRLACKFCYEDGERLREVFRRTREHINKRIPRT